MARYMVKIGGAVGDVGEIKFGFYAPDDAYDNIGDELGVKKIKGSKDAKGVVFGVNTPKPTRIRITYLDKNIGADRKKSCIRYCDPDKAGRVLNGSINDKKVKVRGNSYNIESVSTPG